MVTSFPILLLLTVTSQGKTLDYGMVMDVGSTHTQLFVYAWSHREASSNKHVKEPESRPIEIGASRRVSPGIQDTIPQSYEGIVNYLKPLIDDAKNLTINLSSRWSKFPIYFKATAGMRILTDYRRTQILSWVRTALLNNSFNPFYFENNNAIILSGEEEATFDWLTVNYLNNKLFTDNNNNYNNNNSYSLTNTLGSLDLGGESTQITFAALPSSDILQSFTNVHLWDVNYRLYTHSFLKYGSSAIYDRIGQLSYEESLILYNISCAEKEIDFVNNDYIITNPCLNNGFNDSFNISLIYNNDIYYNLTEYGNSKLNLLECRNYIKKLFYNNTVCLTGINSCNINGVYQKSIIYQNMTFYAFSGFAYTIIDFGLSETINLKQIWNITQIICNMSYLQLNNSIWAKKLIENNAFDYLSSRCITMTYVFSLLHDAYGFPLENSNIIFVDSTPNGTSYDWTLGSILRDANWLSYTLKDDNNLTQLGQIYQYIAFSVSGVLLLTCIFLVYGIISSCRKRDNSNQKGYGKMEYNLEPIY